MKSFKRPLAFMMCICLLLSVCTFETHGLTAEQNELNFESITVKDITIIENTYGYYDESGNFIYDSFAPEFSVLKSDKSLLCTSKGGGFTSDGNWYYLSIDSSTQNAENGFWTPGHTYETKATLYTLNDYGGVEYLDISDTFNVTVIECPVKSLTIDNLSVAENTKGFWQDGHYIYSFFAPGFTVEMKSGNVYSVDADQYNVYLPDNGRMYLSRYESTQYEEGYWNTGRTYEAKAWLIYEDSDGKNTDLGISGLFNVTVTENPFESLTIDDLSIVENTCGYFDDNGQYIYTNFTPSFTLKMKDGRSFSVSEGSSGISIDDKWHSLCFTSVENDGHWTKGNTYNVTAELSDTGVNNSFNVTVTDNPVESLEINDLSIIEGTNGSLDLNGKFIYNYFNTSFKLKLKDGREFQNDQYSSGVNIDGKYYYLDTYTDQSEESGYWTVGNTYTVNASILGYSTSFNVTIVESPIAKIEVPDISVIENTHGSFNNTHYVYDSIFPSFKITMKDGREIETHCGSATIDSINYDIKIYTKQNDIDGYWTVGNTYRVTATAGGAECEFNISVIENPVVGIEINDFNIFEHEMYIDDDGVPKYNVDDYVEYGFRLKDGSLLECEPFKYPARMNSEGGMGGAGLVVYIGGLSYSIEHFEDDQDEHSWGIGSHTVTAHFLSAEGKFNITVKESAIKSVVAKDMVIYSEVDAKYVVDGGYGFAPEYTVTFKDGTSKSFPAFNREFLDLGYCTLMFNMNESVLDLSPGNTYKLTGSFGHIKCEFNVTVEENPISDIEVVKQPDKTEYLIGEHFDARGAVIRIKYNDNTYEDMSVERSDLTYYSECYCKRLNRYVRFGYYSFFNLKETYTTTILSKDIEFKIKVKENDWQSIKAENNGKDAPVLKAICKNGEEVHLNLTGLRIESEETVEGGKKHSAIIMTDSGAFDCDIYSYDDGTYIVQIGKNMAQIGANEWLSTKLSTGLKRLGDLNNDGKINTVDALLALQATVGKTKLDIDRQMLADVDKSGNVTINDALLILQMAVGKIKSFY